MKVFVLDLFCCRRRCLYLSPSISHWFVLCRELFLFGLCVCVFGQGALGFVILSLFQEEEKNLMRKKAILKRNLVCTLGYRE